MLMKKPSNKKQPLPRLDSDDSAANFVEDADLSEYDLSGGQPLAFEFEKKTTQINMRMPQKLVDAIKAKARARGIPYQRFIRETLERALR